MGARCAILTGAAASDKIARTLAGHDGGYRILETEPIAAAVVSTPR